MAAQRLWMRGYDGSTFRRHVPDLLLQHRNGAFTVVDVKPERMMKKPKVIDVLKWTDRVCRERGWQHEVWSGTDPTELSNVRFLSLAKRSQFVDRAASERVSAVAADRMTIDQILTNVAGRTRRHSFGGDDCVVGAALAVAMSDGLAYPVVWNVDDHGRRCSRMSSGRFDLAVGADLWFEGARCGVSIASIAAGLSSSQIGARREFPSTASLPKDER
ncbi:uncharacterized protein RMCC_4842 [Mycolicibacterium canariasense]|uniref:TnsA-like heteromeric transposase endonuclease subunit n=1 Tax=Mycolicibacterium canariasense TaxID=228230 RepID=A0A117IBG3_MYCCR|nr:hypothetical protein [Mycolicibacterium canariasense]MCV7209866.1 hypothetical protein [Mycolicibacterium canariasense]GAS97877.1 uncharacterized protein RMCC_4842 [Mycolicibacterium canariasense]